MENNSDRMGFALIALSVVAFVLLAVNGPLKSTVNGFFNGFKDWQTQTFNGINESNKQEVTHTAYSWSSDGTDRFTTTKPNLNLLTGTSNQIVQATDWYMKVADIKYDKSRGGTLSASVLINNADHASDLVQGGASVAMQTLDASGNILKSADGGTIDYNANGISWCSISIDNNTASVQVFIFTNNMMFNAYYSRLKLEPGSTATSWMPSASEVKPSDQPKYIGTYTDKNDLASQDPTKYTWKLNPDYHE